MSLILNIDTALEKASVCLAKENDVLQMAINENQKDHASWLHPAINEFLKKSGMDMKELDAVAVSIGPGSYTGLRVGLSAAKGFCFALNIPLITVTTPEILAFAVKEEATDLICPVIDARRMEVYAAIYDKKMQEITPPHAILVDETSFASYLSSHKILFCGSGVEKLKATISNGNAFFSKITGDAPHLARLSFQRFQKKEFANLAYAEPKYVKEFYTPSRNS